jgi:glycolate oxidase
VATLPASLLREFAAVVGVRGLIADHDRLLTYDCDGLTNFRESPLAVLLPETTAQVQALLRLCYRERVPFVARGSGTGLSGGSLPHADGVVLSLTRMNKILKVDIANERVVVQPGVINQHVTDAVAPYGYFYAPDPSSQPVCTIGGNIAENAGGVHCLKFGFTTTHVLALEAVLPDGEIVRLGGPCVDAPGYDVLGMFVGSEGTLGVATEATLRVMRRPETVQVLLAAFDSIPAAAQAVSDTIADGMLPAAMEIMDKLSLEAVEPAVHAGYPVCDALLLVELSGGAEEVASQTQRVEEICRQDGAWEIRIAKSPAERALFWKGRKATFGAMGRYASGMILQDGVVPRTALPRVVAEIAVMAQAAGLRVASVFHAGDGNLHPLVLFDRAIEGQQHAAEELAFRILDLCIASGGSITGEHGVGKEKQQAMGRMFFEPDLDTMQRVQCAFDPLRLANPDKIFPRPRLCGEPTGRPYEPHPLEKSGIAEFF